MRGTRPGAWGLGAWELGGYGGRKGIGGGGSLASVPDRKSKQLMTADKFVYQ